MEVTKILESLKEVVTEECYKDILNIIEGLFVDDKRGDLLDDISKGLTGKTIKQHLKIKTEKAGDKERAKLFNEPDKKLLP